MVVFITFKMWGCSRVGLLIDALLLVITGFLFKTDEFQLPVLIFLNY